MRKIAIALALTCAPVVCLAADDDALINTLNGGIDRGPPGETAAEVRPRHGNNRGAPRKSNNRWTFSYPPMVWWSPKVVDILRASLPRVCEDNGKSWFDLGYVTKCSVWDRDRFITTVLVDKAACGY
jgi:hypothetical protein